MTKGFFAGIAAVVCGGLVLASVTWAQTRDRDVRPGVLLQSPDVFRLLGPGSEIGVSVRELTADEINRAGLEQAGGVYVQTVRDGSPAARAGLRSGDVVVAFDGERVRGVRHFSRLVSETPPGRLVRAEVVRDGARQTLEVTPEAGERFSAMLPELRREIERGMRALPREFEFDLPVPGAAARGRLGITLTPLTDQLAEYFGVKEGVLVSAVESGSPAASAGVRAGDVITAIDGTSVRTPGDVAAKVRAAEAGSTLDVRMVREKKERSVKLVPEVPKVPGVPGVLDVASTS